MTMLKHPVLIIILKRQSPDHSIFRAIQLLEFKEHQILKFEFKLKILRHLRKAKGIVSSYVEYDINIHASSLYFNFFLI